jgi:hypothetical protein
MTDHKFLKGTKAGRSCIPLKAGFRSRAAHPDAIGLLGPFICFRVSRVAGWPVGRSPVTVFILLKNLNKIFKFEQNRNLNKFEI